MVPNAFHDQSPLYNHIRGLQMEVPIQYRGPMIISRTSDQMFFPRPLEIPKSKFSPSQYCRHPFTSEQNDQIFSFLVHPSPLNEQCTPMVHDIPPKTAVAVFSMLSPKVLFC